MKTEETPGPKEDLEMPAKCFAYPAWKLPAEEGARWDQPAENTEHKDVPFQSFKVSDKVTKDTCLLI